jgi:hypothetical protein
MDEEDQPEIFQMARLQAQLANGYFDDKVKEKQSGFGEKAIVFRQEKDLVDTGVDPTHTLRLEVKEVKSRGAKELIEKRRAQQEKEKEEKKKEEQERIKKAAAEKILQIKARQAMEKALR